MAVDSGQSPTPASRARWLLVLTLFVVVSCAGLVAVRPFLSPKREADSIVSTNAPAIASQDTGLSRTISLLATRAADLEDNKDVKCWTSFKLLETFIAGCQLTPETTHLKTQIVINYLNQIWAHAALHDDGQVIEEMAMKASIAHFVRWESDPLLEYRVTFPPGQVRVPYQDVQNFLSTVEPIRMLQSLALGLFRTDPARKGLSSDSLDSAFHVAALLTTLVLSESNNVAREKNHSEIGRDDVLQADLRISEALRFNRLDPTAEFRAPDDATDDEESGALMHAIVRQKIQSLRVFNTNYSRDQLGRSFVAKLADHEAEWAGLPVDAEVSQAYKQVDLVELAEFLYESCARMHPDSDPVTGLQMLDAIQASYPFVTHFEHGTIHLYPNQPRIVGLKVEEFEADAFRDSSWHWRAIELMLQRTSDRELPQLDLYALEELSEFLSVFSVAYVKLAGQLARKHTAEAPTTVGPAAFKSARNLFVLASRDHQQAEKSVRNISQEQAVAVDPAVRAEVLASVRSAYVEDCFSDVTSATGIDFRHESSALVEEHRFLPRGERPQDIAGYVNRAQRMRELGYTAKFPNHSLGIEGGGVAVGDIDGDRLPDVYLVNGAGDQLYRNRGGLRFEDVTEQALPSDPESHQADGEGRGAYFVDYDNDGDQDLFITQVYAPNRLLQNQGHGKFVDVTRRTGFPLRKDLISQSAVWFDFDRDGFLDVYIGNYGDWLGDELPLVQADSRNGQPNLFYRNTGQGGFEDVSTKVDAADVGWAQAVSHFDANQDGWQDLYVANDFGQDLILVNQQGERFEKRVIGEGRYLHGMSVGFTDVNNDGAEDVYVSNISTFSFTSKYIQPGADSRIAVSHRIARNMRMLENNLLLVSSSGGYEEQHHARFERSEHGSGWAWDADFFDFDNDGEEDLYILNGREPNLSYAFERNVLYKQRAGQFYDVSAISGADFKSNARGAAFSDFDRDGDLDIVVNSFQGGAVVLRNNLQRHNWIRLRLQGTLSNRDAVGARVTLHTRAGPQRRTVRGGSGFLSRDDVTVHFGLGNARAVDRVEIDWPSGRQQSVPSLPVNQIHEIVEPN